MGFLYYSGHGIASAGENYLIPTDVDEPSTVSLSVQGVKQSEVLAILRGEAPNAAHYLVLDACRNTLQGARGGKGFVPVGQQSGVLVAFATEPGKTAMDLGQGSGPYAAALAAELVRPAQNDLLMFHNVRVAVMDKTNGDQVPWTEDGIQRRQRVLFGGEAKATGTPPSSQPVPMRRIEEEQARAAEAQRLAAIKAADDARSTNNQRSNVGKAASAECNGSCTHLKNSCVESRQNDGGDPGRCFEALKSCKSTGIWVGPWTGKTFRNPCKR